jgi:DeoR/GlpR family transcriptional regulator of sugar metabolism
MSRKEHILELIAKGYNNVKTLAEHFGVSLMTIYRDVRELEKELQGNEVQSCVIREFISDNPINCFSWWRSL